MTTTKDFLRALLIDGEPRTTLEIAEILGVSELDARMSICNWRRDGYLESAPVVYTITPKGRAKAGHQPKAKPPKASRADEMVRAAIRQNPNSAFNMGIGNGLT